MRRGTRTRTGRRLWRSFVGGLSGIALIALYNVWQTGETQMSADQILFILSLVMATTCFYDLWAERATTT